MSEWLQMPWSGHPVWSWLLALLSVLLAVVLTRLLRPHLVRRLAALAARTETQVDEALVYALEATQPWLIGAMVLRPATAGLVLSASLARVVEVVALVGLFAQIGIWIGRLLDFWILQSRQHALATDPGASTGLSVTSLIARAALWSLLLLLLDNLGINVTTLVAGLGVGGIAVGFALQNILGDLFSSLSIVLDKPFQIGHFVDVDGFLGTVEHIGLKTTRMRSLSGELLVFSNAA